jgi:hypothetical protein
MKHLNLIHVYYDRPLYKDITGGTNASCKTGLAPAQNGSTHPAIAPQCSLLLPTDIKMLLSDVFIFTQQSSAVFDVHHSVRIPCLAAVA